MKILAIYPNAEKTLIDPEQGFELSNKWFSFNHKCPSLATSTMNSSNVRFSLLNFKKEYTFKGVGVFATGGTAAGRLGRIGLYSNNFNKPNALIVDLGSLDFATTGEKTASFSNLTVTPGLYWMGLSTNNAPVLTAFNAGNSYYDVFGASTITASGFAGYQMAYGYTGSLPATATGLTTTGSAISIFLQIA
ncbi:hypothetical protein [Dolichospermum phage Dfl-JY23]